MKYKESHRKRAEMILIFYIISNRNKEIEDDNEAGKFV